MTKLLGGFDTTDPLDELTYDEFDAQLILEYLQWQERMTGENANDPGPPWSANEDEFKFAHQNPRAWDLLPDRLPMGHSHKTAKASFELYAIRHLAGQHDQSKHGKHGKAKLAPPSDEDSERLNTKIRDQGGFTYSVANGSSLKTGYALSPYPERSAVIDTSNFGSSDLKSYVNTNSDLLAEPDHYIGAWREQGDGVDKVWLDVSIVSQDRLTAEAIGKKFNQKAMYDLGAGEEISLGGTGAAN